MNGPVIRKTWRVAIARWNRAIRQSRSREGNGNTRVNGRAMRSSAAL
jgi:hypothetical protein